jgi:hypothetical protein
MEHYLAVGSLIGSQVDWNLVSAAKWWPTLGCHGRAREEPDQEHSGAQQTEKQELFPMTKLM